MHIWYGYDNNADGVSNDIYPTAYRYKGIDDAGVPSFKEIGPCETVNCGRGAPLSQLNLRVSKAIRIRTGMNVEIFGEVFNVTNEINPAFNVGAATAGARSRARSPTPRRTRSFMKPNAFAGDAGQPEQRVGQIGFRFTF